MKKGNRIFVVLLATILRTSTGYNSDVKAQLQDVQKTISQVASKIIALERKNAELEEKVSHQSSKIVELHSEIDFLSDQLNQTKTNFSASVANQVSENENLLAKLGETPLCTKYTRCRHSTATERQTGTMLAQLRGKSVLLTLFPAGTPSPGLSGPKNRGCTGSHSPACSFFRPHQFPTATSFL